MALLKHLQAFGATGKTVYGVVIRDADGYYLATAGSPFASGVGYPAFAEDGSVKGRYSLSTSAISWDDGAYTVVVYQQAGGSPAPVSDTVIAADSFRVVSDAIVVLDASVAGAAKPGDVMALTAGERTTLVAAIEAALINEADGQQMLTAIINKINATDVDLAGLSVGAIATAAAAAILAVPANKLATDGSGKVDVSDKAGFAPTAIQVREEMDANSVKLANLDAPMTSRGTFSGGAVTEVIAPVKVTVNKVMGKTRGLVKL